MADERLTVKLDASMPAIDGELQVPGAEDVGRRKRLPHKGDGMTQRERAEAATAVILRWATVKSWEDLPQDAAVEKVIAETIWRACVDASNDELERRREMERSRDRAIRLQSALEVRNAQLEEWLEQLGMLLDVAPDLAYAKLRRIINEFRCEDGQV